MKRPSKLTNEELLSINSGMNFVVLESRFDRNLAEGDRVLTVRFSRPVLKRPLTSAMCDFILTLAKHHPRHWVIEVTGHYSDGTLHYDETAEIESPEPVKLDWLTEAVKSAESDVKAAGNPRHLLGVSWRAWIKTEADRRLRK